MTEKQRAQRERIREARHQWRVRNVRRANKIRSHALASQALPKFWAQVDKGPGHGPNGDCWLWTGTTGAGGYGRFCGFGKLMLTHRFSWARANQQPIPKGMHICHRCHVAACCNPAHLYLGTPMENRADTAARLASDPVPWPPERVASLRARLGDTVEAFADRLGVGATAVARWEAGETTPRGMRARLLALLEVEHAAVGGDVVDAGAHHGAA